MPLGLRLGNTKFNGILVTSKIVEKSLKKDQLGLPNNLCKMILDYNGLGFSFGRSPCFFSKKHNPGKIYYGNKKNLF